MANSFEQSVNDLYSGKSSLPEITDLGLGTNTSNPYQVSKRITGQSPGPLPSQIPPGTPKAFDSKANLQATRDYLDGLVKSNEDGNHWATVQSYSTGPLGATYKKYQNLQRYGDLEFSPVYDNSKRFDADTNFFGDIYRTTTQSLFPLAWNGIKGNFSSMNKIVNEGDFLGEDRELARDYAYYSTLSHSSKNNLGSFVNNLLMNFGYTAGIMSTAILENWVGAGLSAFTGAKTVTSKAANLLSKTYKTGDAVDGVRTYSNVLAQYDDIDNVRQAFEAANKPGVLQRALQSPVGQVLNPLSNIADNYYSALNSYDDITGYFNTAGSMFNTAGAAYRDFRNLNMALSESRLEAGMVANTVIDDLYNDFYTRNGRAPSDEEWKDIRAQASQAAYETAGMNAGLIYLTNKISFDNILNPRVGAQGYLTQRLVDWKTIGGGRFGELGNVLFDVAAKEWKFAEKGFKTWWNRWKTDPFHKSAWGTVGYFKRNLTEGLQEIAQESIADANERYYKDSFYTSPVRKNLIAKAAFGKGTTPLAYYGKSFEKYSPLSAEGFPIFASGLAMGSLAGGINNSMTFLYEKANQIFDPVTYEKYKTEKTEIVEGLITKMNAFSVDDVINNRLLNGGTQHILAKVQENGNKKEVMDAETEALVSHMTYLHEYGVLDLYLDAISSYTGMTTEEYKESFPNVEESDIPKHKQRIGEVVTQAKQIKERMDTYSKVFPNPVDLSEFPKDHPDYEEAKIMHEAWNWGIKSAVFYNEVYDDVRKRMINIMDKHYEIRPLKGMSKRQSDIILRPEAMENEIGLLKNEIDSLLSVGDPESKKLAKEKKKLLESYELYNQAYLDFSDYYHRDRYFNRAKVILEEQKGEGSTITDEEVNKYLDDQFGPRNSEVETDVLENLEAAYNNLLNSISSEPDDFLFGEQIDNAFELVLDFYKLNDESRGMVDVINLMNDPDGFIDVFKRNNKWMNDLWLKRGDYYRDIVTQEISNIEDNAILNFLARDGIFMEASDFVLFRDQGIPPKEFYDEKKNLVIPEGSLAYNRYYQKLIEYRDLKSLVERAQQEVSEGEIELRIQQLVERRDRELKKLDDLLDENLKATTGESREDWERKTPSQSEGRTKEEIDKEKEGVSGVINILEEAKTVDEINSQWQSLQDNNLIPENYEEIGNDELLKNLKEAKKFTKYLISTGVEPEMAQRATQNKYVLLAVLNGKMAELEVEEPRSEEEAIAPIQTTEAWKDYTKQSRILYERYDKLIEKLKTQLQDAKKDGHVPVTVGQPAPVKKEAKEVPLNATWDELPDDLKNELTTEFNAFLSAPESEGGLGRPSNFMSTNPQQYEMFKNNWFEEYGLDYIKKYNGRPVDEVSIIPVIKFLTDLKKPITEYGISEIRIIRDDLQRRLNKGSDDKGNAYTPQEKANIKSDINGLTKYLEFRRNTFVPQDNTQRVFRLFEEMVLNKQDNVSRIFDEEGNVIGYEFPGKDGKPKRVTKLTEEIENKIKNKEPFLYDAIKETYIDPRTGKERGGQLLNLFRAIQQDQDIKTEKKLEAFMGSVESDVKNKRLPQLNSVKKLEKIKAALEKNFTEESLIAVVKDVAYSESTIAGNLVDDMIRESFNIDSEGKFIKPKKNDMISQEAYDEIFGDDGIVRKLQDDVIDGKYIILSKDVLIYDPELLDNGLVGAMDLVLIDVQTQTGGLNILDIKTSKNWDTFNDEENEYSKKLLYRIQTSIYRVVLHNMMGEKANTSLLPIELNIDMDGYIRSAKSAAKQLNQPQIRKIKSKILLEEKKASPDPEVLKELQTQLNILERAITVPLLPVSDELLEQNGVVFRQPNLPDNLKPESLEKPKKEELTEQEKKNKIRSIKGQLTRTRNTIAKTEPTIKVKNKLVPNPLLEQLRAKELKLEEELNLLEGKTLEDREQESKIQIKKQEIAKLEAEKQDLLKSRPTTTGTQANIERRRREATTFTSSRRFIKGINHEVSIAKKFGLEGFDVDVSTKANTSTGFLYDNSLSEHFDTIEEAIEYANQIIQGDKEYIKKVDAELAASEQPASVDTSKIDKKIEKAKKELADLESALKPKAGSKESNIKDEIDAINKGIVKTELPDLQYMSIDDYNRHMQNITDAKTLDELEVAYNNAFIDISLEDPEYLTVLDTTKQARELALNINTSVARGNLQVGEYLLSKSPIFGIVENEIVVVTKITKTGKVTVSQVEDITNGKPMQKKYTQEEIERSFTKTNPVALAQEEDEGANIVDTEQEENIEISKSSLEDFSKNPDLIDKAKQNAASMSKKDRLAALKNASKDDNINNCKPKS